MKAFALTSIDQPAGLVDLPVPDLAEDGVRVRVRAASVNGFDVFQANGYLFSMVEHAFPTVIGRDGTYAEVVSGASGLVLARKPDRLSFETAAAIPLVGATALDAVDAIDVGPGDTVVVAGATGGVGSIAVQLAAQRGATVIATAKPGEVAFVRELGASATVDYSSGDVAEAIRGIYPDGVTALIDTVNRGEALAPMAALVRDGGRIATTLGTADVEALAARDVRATNLMGTPTPEKLSALAEQAAAGTLRVEIQETYPLAEAPRAFAAFMAGTRGKLVVTVG